MEIEDNVEVFKAYIIKVTIPYGQYVYMVFAEDEKEAKTRLYGHPSARKGDREVVMRVWSTYEGEDIIELGGSSE